MAFISCLKGCVLLLAIQALLAAKFPFITSFIHFFLANWKCFGSSKALSVQFRGETNSRYWSNERYARSVVPIVLGWRRRTTGTRIYWPNKKLTLFVSKKGLFDLRIASNLDDSIAFQNDENRQNREVGDDYWRCSWMVCRNS